MARRGVPFGMAFPAMIILGLILFFVGTQLCGNVEFGKDVRVALETGDTVRSDNLPRDSLGQNRYAYECIRERRLGDIGWPHVLVGLGIIGWILYGLARDWREKRKEDAGDPYA